MYTHIHTYTYTASEAARKAASNAANTAALLAVLLQHYLFTAALLICGITASTSAVAVAAEQVYRQLVKLVVKS
jgi:Na+-translocating ferredoxin:NAD+ oxidoreductase RnfD subunit